MRSLLTVLAAAALAAWPAAAAAQTFGAKGGVDLTSITDNAFVTTATPRPGGTVGGFVGLPLVFGIGVQGEVLVTRQRTRLEDVVDDTLTYLEIPVLLRYRVWGAPERLHVHAAGGVVYRSLLTATETIFGVEGPIDDAVNGSDVGAAIGAQVQVRPRWIAEVRYVQGLSDVYNRFGGGRTGRHRTWQFTVAYAIRK